MPTAWEKRAYNKQRVKLAKLYEKHRAGRWRGLTDANDICISCIKKVINKNPYDSLHSWQKEVKKKYMKDASGKQMYTKTGKRRFRWVPTFNPLKRWESKIKTAIANGELERAKYMG